MKKKAISNPFIWPDFDWRNLNSQDWSLYFQNTLFKVKLKKHPDFIWAKITNGGLPNIELHTEVLKKKFMVRMEDIEAFDFSLPPTGAYNYKNSVVFFFRKFTRQWRKGICKDSSYFESILDHYKIGKLNERLIDSSFLSAQIPAFLSSPKDIAQLFSCKFYSFKDAYALIESGTAVARALSNKLVLSLGAKTLHPLIWFGSLPVGIVESAKPDISLFYPEVAHEIGTLIPTAEFLTEDKQYVELLDVEADIAF